jgi:hypothetical protein
VKGAEGVTVDVGSISGSGVAVGTSTVAAGLGTAVGDGGSAGVERVHAFSNTVLKSTAAHTILTRE